MLRVLTSFFSLRREGVADSDLWAELGIKLDENGETIKVAQNNPN